MSNLQEQLIALGGVFQAAVLVDRIARTGQASEATWLHARQPAGPRPQGHPGGVRRRRPQPARRLPRTGGALERDPSSLQREPLRYALSMLGLERQLAKRGDLLDTIGNRLPQIQSQAEHFGLVHENVIASSGACTRTP
jgi:high frequency lysogenization protein